MGSGNFSVNFTGRIDDSVYNYAKSLKKQIQKSESKSEDLTHIEQRTSEILDALKRKVETLHKDTVIAVKHNTADNNDYLVAYNKALKSAPVQTPASKSLSWFENLMPGWQLNNLPMGKKMVLGLNGSSDQTIDILERRVQDLNERETDKKLLDSAVKNLLAGVKDKKVKSSKYVDAIKSVSADLGIQERYSKDIANITESLNK